MFHKIEVNQQMECEKKLIQILEKDCENVISKEIKKAFEESKRLDSDFIGIKDT